MTTLELDDDADVVETGDDVVAEDVDATTELLVDKELLEELVEDTPGELSRSDFDEPPPQAASNIRSETPAAWHQR